jgi:hypothetical protein
MGFGTATAESATDQAYTQTRDWLLGASFQGPCSLSSGGWTCSIINTQGDQDLLVWADTNSSASSYSPASQFTEYQDLTGAVHPIASGASIPIDEDPILLEGASTATTSSTTSSTTSPVPEFPAWLLLPTMVVCLAIVSLAARMRGGDSLLHQN